MNRLVTTGRTEAHTNTEAELLDAEEEEEEQCWLVAHPRLVAPAMPPCIVDWRQGEIAFAPSSPCDVD
jgi:hypothetical protein